MGPGELLLPLAVPRNRDVHASELNHVLVQGCVELSGASWPAQRSQRLW